MAHAQPDFETKDVLGKTKHFNGLVGLVPEFIPAAPSGKISRVFVKCSNDNTFSKSLSVAFDGGLTYVKLQKGEWIEWSPKNNDSDMPIQQLRLVGSASDVAYEIIMDFEP